MGGGGPETYVWWRFESGEGAVGLGQRAALGGVAERAVVTVVEGAGAGHTARLTHSHSARTFLSPTPFTHRPPGDDREALEKATIKWTDEEMAARKVAIEKGERVIDFLNSRRMVSVVHGASVAGCMGGDRKGRARHRLSRGAW